MERRIYHVMRREDDFWQVIKDGFKRPHIVSDSKEKAVILAKRLAKTGPESQVIVYAYDNSVETEYVYHPQRAA